MRFKHIFKAKNFLYLLLGTVTFACLLSLAFLYLQGDLGGTYSQEAYVYVDGYEVRLQSESRVTKVHAKNKEPIRQEIFSYH